jgi:hypothetical protein
VIEGKRVTLIVRSLEGELRGEGKARCWDD